MAEQLARPAVSAPLNGTRKVTIKGTVKGIYSGFCKVALGRPLKTGSLKGSIRVPEGLVVRDR